MLTAKDGLQNGLMEVREDTTIIVMILISNCYSQGLAADFFQLSQIILTLIQS